ncbi:CHAD domain containing protein [Leucobacter sp. 7(1)]|uniref:CYTH domain-containing protein n=1 Tax=Leucobacter sp. 7(1) TaxID=1255613 RepID=UPI00097E92B9|nr:CYTH domain-containing protein [Leucobacter sp. 7(1)]SJN08292.1 CHAD domain containing protein [Leucobacter sp. 7(1)]
MTSNAARESLEIERKYEVDVAATMPTPEQFRAAGFEPDPPVTFPLRARYFDTVDEALARAGVALRVREGGTDAGWHIKVRQPGGVRELQWPLAEELPEALVAELRALVGDAADKVQPRATMDTERTVVLLRDAAGVARIELADDSVRTADLAAGVRRAWREWEAELLPGADESELDAVDPVLRGAGAVPSASPAKIARATGRLIALAQARGADAAQLAALAALDAADQEAARRLDT